jgi:protein SCO1/2
MRHRFRHPTAACVSAAPFFATLLFAGLTVVAAIGCRQAPPPREYQLVGQILALAPDRNEVTIKHEDVKNFMPGMTMPFTVKDRALLSGKAPGDLVTATLVVAEVGAHLSTLTATGHAPLAEAPPAATPAVLQPGGLVEDAVFIDQDGAKRQLSSWRGHRTVLTFIYTRCPLPEFCPLMDRQFAAIQRQLTGKPALSDVRLVSMTLDPEYDKASVLKSHARMLEADPRVWAFVTATPEDARAFWPQFGILSERENSSDVEVTHNLRTAILDAEGRLVRIHTGNQWTPADVVADLEATPAPAR